MASGATELELIAPALPKLAPPSPGGAGSTTVTRAPSRWSRKASARPTMPAPMTRTLRADPVVLTIGSSSGCRDSGAARDLAPFQDLRLDEAAEGSGILAFG